MMRKIQCSAAAAWLAVMAIVPAWAIQTETVEIGNDGNYDATVFIERDAQGNMTLRDQATGPVALSALAGTAAHASSHESGGADAIHHDALTGFVANEHIDWTGAASNLETTGNAVVGDSLATYRHEFNVKDGSTVWGVNPLGNYYTDIYHNTYYSGGFRSLGGGPGVRMLMGGGSSWDSGITFFVSPDAQSLAADATMTLITALSIDKNANVSVPNGNLILSGNYLSGDGADEGIRVETDGAVLMSGSLSVGAGVSMAGECKVKVYAQPAEPALSANDFFAFWKDTDDGNRMFLVFRRGNGDQVKIELN